MEIKSEEQFFLIQGKYKINEKLSLGEGDWTVTKDDVVITQNQHRESLWKYVFMRDLKD